MNIIYGKDNANPVGADIIRPQDYVNCYVILSEAKNPHRRNAIPGILHFVQDDVADVWRGLLSLLSEKFDKSSKASITKKIIVARAYIFGVTVFLVML